MLNSITHTALFEMPTYSAEQIIGKTLIARQNVAIKRLPTSAAPVVYTAKPGSYVGTVYSWVTEGPDLYWQFYDSNGKAYYSLHRPGLYSIDSLQDQGALTVKEQTDQATGVTVLDKVLQKIGMTAQTAIWIVAWAVAISYATSPRYLKK